MIHSDCALFCVSSSFIFYSAFCNLRRRFCGIFTCLMQKYIHCFIQQITPLICEWSARVIILCHCWIAAQLDGCSNTLVMLSWALAIRWLAGSRWSRATGRRQKPAASHQRKQPNLGQQSWLQSVSCCCGGWGYCWWSLCCAGSASLCCYVVPQRCQDTFVSLCRVRCCWLQWEEQQELGRSTAANDMAGGTATAACRDAM